MAEIDDRMAATPDNSVELTKKRKLRDDLANLSLPLSKHKFGDRIRCFGPATLEEHEKIKEMVTKVRDPLEDLEESKNDSNSITESYGTTMTLDLDEETDKFPQRSRLQELPSTSSDNSTGSTCRSVVNFSKVEESSRTKQDVWNDFEQLHYEFRGAEKLNSDEEAYDDYCILSELGKTGIELLDVGLEDGMLYSNDVLPNAILLSSGIHNNGQDTRSVARKTTIDQEFEQYFSTLML